MMDRFIVLVLVLVMWPLLAFAEWIGRGVDWYRTRYRKICYGVEEKEP